MLCLLDPESARGNGEDTILFSPSGKCCFHALPSILVGNHIGDGEGSIPAHHVPGKYWQSAHGGDSTKLENKS